MRRFLHFRPHTLVGTEPLAFCQDRTNPTESCGPGNVQRVKIVLQPNTNCGTQPRGNPMVCGAEKTGASPNSWEIQALVAVPGRTTP